MKLCVLFPGIGYHCGKPLLQRTIQLAADKGYTTLPLEYKDFPDGAKGNDDIMRIAVAHAISQTEQQLANVDFSNCDRVVFVGKSIGTAACLAYRKAHNISADCVLLTPLEMTFENPAHNCIAFHGTADPWAATKNIERICKDKNVTLFEYPNANHSLITGIAAQDETTLASVITKISDFI